MNVSKRLIKRLIPLVAWMGFAGQAVGQGTGDETPLPQLAPSPYPHAAPTVVLSTRSPDQNARLKLQAHWNAPRSRGAAIQVTIEGRPSTPVLLAAGAPGGGAVHVLGVYTLPADGRIVLEWDVSARLRPALEEIAFLAAELPFETLRSSRSRPEGGTAREARALEPRRH